MIDAAAQHYDARRDAHVVMRRELITMPLRCCLARCYYMMRDADRWQVGGALLRCVHATPPLRHDDADA